MPFPNPNGQPTKYGDEIPTKVGEYLQYCKLERKRPKRAGFALYLGISRNTLNLWEKKYPELREVLYYIDTVAEDDLWEGGLTGKYQSAIVKLALYNYGYSDKSEVKSENTSTIDVTSDVNISLEERLKKTLDEIKDLQAEE